MSLVQDCREIVAEQLDYRELLYQMTKRDLLLRYKQTAMGFAWALFMPLLNTVVFSVIFSRVAPLDVGMPYPLFAFSGLLVWNFFSSSLKFAVASLVANYALVTKVYFPREIMPFSALIVSFIDFLVASPVLIGLMIYYGMAPSGSIVLLPLVVLVHVAFTAAVALALSMSNLFFRDVKYLFEVAVQVWMFATSVLYPADALAGRLGLLMRLNPMTPIVDAYRDVLLRGRWPSEDFAIVAVVSFVALGVSWLAFHRAEFRFAENI